ncbi:MAG: rRNA small subunit methyltransferase B [Promicromonosporaceae bacterium]|nr:rRNA small subunit methyltransferase B [Promicromonosporaceae bacterium]
MRDSDQNRDFRRNHQGRERGAARTRNAGHRSRNAPSQRRQASDPARQLAFEVLREVSESDAYANLVLPPRLKHRKITGRDAAFATELTYGTLRMQGRYDAILANCVDRPLKKLDQGVLLALRLGAHQLLGMRVPPHAAVSETVALARANLGAGAAQLINAVLRNVAERDLDQWLEILNSEAQSPIEALAAIESHPLWIARAFREALAHNGRDAGELPALLQADNDSPKVNLVVRPGLTTPEDHTVLEAETVPGELAPTARIMERGGDPAALPGVRAGRIGVQDEGSQVVALAVVDQEITGPDARWLDMCAGPGGKAALLGAIAAERGATLLANEIAPHRAELVKQALKAIPEAAIEAVRVGDAVEFGELEPGAFDRVLLDAPCSGLGSLRRRPESRWRRTPADVSELRLLQIRLLGAALKTVRVGGVVGYVTCSPHLAETVTVVADVLKRAPETAEVVATRQLWPHVEGTDAMHLTLLRRLS